MLSAGMLRSGSIDLLARVMNMETIAESVEVVALLPHLRSLGIAYGQGFALHNPEPL